MEEDVRTQRDHDGPGILDPVGGGQVRHGARVVVDAEEAAVEQIKEAPRSLVRAEARIEADGAAVDRHGECRRRVEAAPAAGPGDRVEECDEDRGGPDAGRWTGHRAADPGTI